MATDRDNPDSDKRVRQAGGAPLRLLAKFGGSELADRLHLREPTERLLYRGSKAGLRAGAAAAKTFRGLAKPLAKPARLDAPETGPARFDLTLTDEQQLVRDTMRRFADEALRPAAEQADETCTPPAELLAQAHELGLTLMAIPEQLGGAAEARSPVSTVLIAEDLARGDVGLAVAALSPLAVVHTLVDYGSAEQQSRYLPAFADDELVPAALALFEPHPLFDPRRPRTGAVKDPDGGWKLHGVKTMVPLGETARLFLVAAEVLGHGPRLFAVERDTAGLTIEPAPTMGLRAAGLCKLALDGAHVDDGAMIGEPGRDGFDLGAVVDRARIAWGAMAVGGCQAVLDYVAPYCNERKAFGEPISNRQAVAFLIADIAIELEAMRLMVYRAASRAELGKSIEREAALVRAQCTAKSMKIGTDGVQLLGGHGFVKDHPVERWYRHLRGVGIAEGALSI